jgi:signal transduction histidine kinase
MDQRPSPNTSTFSNRRQAPRRTDDQQLSRQIAHLDRELEAALRISDALSQRIKIGELVQHAKVDDLVENALRTALDVVGADAGSVLLSDEESKQLIFRHSIGKRPVPHGTAIPWDKGIAGAVFISGDPLFVPDVKHDPRHLPDIDKLTGYTTCEMLTVPLKRWEGEPLGVLQVMNDPDGAVRLDEKDLSILTIIAALAAAAIEEARLSEEARLAEVVHRLGDIGHDVKNMLTPIVMGATLMQDEMRDFFQSMPELIQSSRAKASRDLFEEVIPMQRRNARRIQDRMREIADCVKGLSAAPNFAPCNLEAVVADVIKTLGVVAEEKGVILRTEGLDTLPEILADERRLYNAFYNLVNNAIPEVTQGGSITVSGHAEPEAGAILLSVADTGRGMPPRVRDSLFTARAISTKPGGTGLGTKIIKDVVDAHGGKITIESTEGVGTTFLIRLPLRPPSATGA